MNKIKYLYLTSRDDFLRVDISRIVYFEADGNYTNFVLSNKLKGQVLMNLSQMQDTLTRSLQEQARIFARVGKRFIVNLSYVYHIDVAHQKLMLTDGERFAYQLPVSKEALKKLKELFVSATNANND
ncbi:MAG: LytTR family transcriptional regulator [Prevotella sp.]|nr:LytTR family transcriptional regulator [Prevotella sp.]